MTTPITATATRPEPPPEPVRPRLYVAIWYDGLGQIPWSAVAQPFTDHDSASRTVDGDRGSRVITIPTDAEAKAHARYIAALEEALYAWRHGKSSAVHLSHEADKARAEWDAERGKA